MRTCIYILSSVFGMVLGALLIYSLISTNHILIRIGAIGVLICIPILIFKKEYHNAKRISEENKRRREGSQDD